MSIKLKGSVEQLEQHIYRTLKLGMSDLTHCLDIRLRYGFELGGAYETWAYEWTVTDPQVMDYRYGRAGRFPLTVSDRSLENAILKWVHARAESKERETQND